MSDLSKQPFEQIRLILKNFHFLFLIKEIKLMVLLEKILIESNFPFQL